MIAVTGASGYVGGAIVERLRRAGTPVLALRHCHHGPDGDEPRFALGRTFDPTVLSGVSAVVHAAWDFSVRGEALRRRNVGGALALLDAATAVGARVILVSSLAAYRGCPTQYGRAKLELESIVCARGGVALRPGLVCGASLGGMFGAIVGAVARHRVVPVPTARQLPRLFLSDDQALCDLIATIAGDGAAPPAGSPPLLAAHPQPVTLSRMIAEIARALDRRPHTLPMPARPAFRLLQFAEALGLRMPFRSDSLLSIAHPIPAGEVARLAVPASPLPAVDLAAMLSLLPSGEARRAKR